METKNITRVYLCFGAIAAILFIAGTTILALDVEGYSPVASTVSEIGRLGSAMEAPFEILLLIVGISVLIMAVGVDRHYKSENWNPILAVFVFAFALSIIGMAIFPTPHPLHNVFGLACIIGYLTPLVYALTAPSSHQIFRPLSWLSFMLIAVLVFLNLSPLFTQALFPLEYYGLVQRGLLYIFYLWLCGLSLTLMKDVKDQAQPSGAVGMA